MLTHLHIENFTLVDKLDIEFFQGLTSVTGETGAGKSITLDALALALGDRADADKVRTNADKAEIQASFDITELPNAQKQLLELEIEHDDECIIRRVVTQQGRSRAFINGIAVTLAQLKNFGDSLIDIHSQHEHQSLLSTQTHRYLLDNFAKAEALTQSVKQHFQAWQSLQKEFEFAKNNSEEVNAQYQLLSYQVNELNELELEENEVEKLEQEQKELSNVTTIAHTCEKISHLCDDDEMGITNSIQKALHLLGDLPVKSPRLNEAESLLQSASIHIEEAKAEVDAQLNSSESDDERLAQLEARLTSIYDVARKHRVHPTELFEHASRLQEELNLLTSGDDQLEQLQVKLADALTKYQTASAKLTQKRKTAAKKLASQVMEKLQLLSMSNATFTIHLEPGEKPSKNGNEEVHFLIATQPGQQPKALNKIASGGELSRISLAIQVVAAQTSNIPTLVFDEVDVGIGGPTGDIVGELLRELGTNGQVICVTHLAQVASKAHNHLLVDKIINKKSVTSKVDYIQNEQVVLELARMMGGDTQSKQSLAHAKEMLNWSGEKTL